MHLIIATGENDSMLKLIFIIIIIIIIVIIIIIIMCNTNPYT